MKLAIYYFGKKGELRLPAGPDVVIAVCLLGFWPYNTSKTLAVQSMRYPIMIFLD